MPTRVILVRLSANYLQNNLRNYVKKKHLTSICLLYIEHVC